jgi:hypothetical protein
MKTDPTQPRESRRKFVVLTAISVVALALFLLAPVARADLSFGPQGSGAGQLSNPWGIAVHFATGGVFVADAGNRRVSVFDEDGDFLRAFGWGVDTGAAALEVCTAASGCQAGLSGSGAGQLAGTAPSIAVDNDPFSPAFGDVFVYDSGNFRVQRFTPAGAFVLAFGDGVNQTTSGDVCTAVSGNTCGAGVNGFGPGQFNSNSTRVEIALGAGTVHVADCTDCGGAGTATHRVQTFDPSGAPLGQPLSVTGSDAGRPTGLSADSAGNFYLATSGAGGVHKYDSSGNSLAVLGSTSQSGLAVDSADNLYVVDGPDDHSPVSLYDPTGTLLSVTYGEELRPLFATRALAARHTPDGDFYGIDLQGAGRIAHVAFEPPGPVVLPGVDDFPLGFHNFASPIGNTKATLYARVNPEGEATTYHFEYIDDNAYQSGGFANPAVQSTPELAVGSDFELYPLSREVTGLTPETTYHFRALATNTDGADTGPERTFTTREPFEFGETYSTAVGTDAATLHAELNPLSVPATGYFEYVTEAEFQASGFAAPIQLPDIGNGAPPLDFGDAEDELVTRFAQAQGLQTDTAYRYRLVAENAFETRTGPEKAFHTFAEPDPPSTNCPNQAFRAGPSAALADCRAYEMVSPPGKDGGEIAVANTSVIGSGVTGEGVPAHLRQATAEGSKLAYSSFRAFGEAEGAGWTSEYVASRDPAEGWRSENVSPPRRSLSFYFVLVNFDPPTTSFTSDLCAAFIRQDSDVALAPGDQAGFPDTYRRDNCDPDAGAYELLTTAAPPTHVSAVGSMQYFPRVQGFSADGSVAVFRANDKLATSGTPASAATVNDGNPIYQTYIQNGTSLRLVSVLPSPGGTTPGTAAARSSSVGNFNTDPIVGRDFRADTLINAVSTDAGRIYWETLDVAGSGVENKLYLRVNPTVAQSPISAGQCTRADRACTYPVSETVDPGPAQFEAATPDGAKALFRFSGGAHANELYTYDAVSKGPSLIAAGVQGVVGASEDLSRFYFVSTAVLDAGAVAGQPNLYLHTEGEGKRFIATLSSATASLDGLSHTPRRRDHLARVSLDGAHAAFVSNAPLTGYDNTDAGGSGRPDAEVFLYDAEAGGGAGELRCVSCKPSGARPAGREMNGGLNGDPATAIWAAALIPGYEYDLHPSRVLSENGNRLFFESFDALLPTDANGAKDVYQWQAPGSGDCDITDSNYFEPNGGCLSLVSTGKGAQDSSFVDASTDGQDVFFTTDEGLWGGDVDPLTDIYDARALGGFPAPPPAEAGCDVDAGACEGQGTVAPDLPGAGTAAFQGLGNPQPRPPSLRCRRGKRKVVRNGRARCVKRQSKRKRHNRDAGYNRRLAR